MYVQIRMPSGRTVTAQANCRIFSSVNCRLSLSICVHAEDMHNSLGLCGDNNGESSHDLVPRNGKIPDPNYFEPILFMASYWLVDCSWCLHYY